MLGSEPRRTADVVMRESKVIRFNAINTCAVAIWLTVAAWVGLPTSVRAQDADLVNRSKAVASDAKGILVDAGEVAAVEASNLWQQVEGQGLAAQSQNDFVVWMIVGALVGAIAGMLTSIRATGVGRLGRLLLGLMGAFIGGLAVRLGHLDFGWQPLLIRYEELLFSFAGAVMLVMLARLLRASTQKKRV